MVFRVLFVLLGLNFLIGGAGKLIGVRFYVDNLARVHVSGWPVSVIGLLEIAAAAGLVVGLNRPELGVVAAFGLVLLMIGAVAFHVRVKDFKGAGLPIALGALATVAASLAVATI